MARVLILYSTTDGHTIEICKRLRERLESHGMKAQLADLKDGPQLGDYEYDKIVIGASIRYGKHQKRVFDFVRQKQDLLDSKPNAFFSVNVVARKPDKNRPDTNPYMQKFLQQIAWQPKQLAVFAGKIDYRKYNFFDRQIIRFIMFLTKGPTDPNTVAEFTDWQQVEAFGRLISEM